MSLTLATAGSFRALSARNGPAASSSASSRMFSSSHPRQALPLAGGGQKIGSTVQSADKALEDMKRAMAQMKKSGRSIDLTTMQVPVIERLVDPPIRIAWVFSAKGRQYLINRAQRYIQTRRFLIELCDMGLFKQRSYFKYSPRSATFQAGHLLPELEEVYVKYNEARAAGDETALRTYSTGEALSSAQALLKARRNMRWECVKVNKPPKLVSVRSSPLDSGGKGYIQCAQVVVTFDTDQTLITRGANAQTKRQRVVETYVFERHVPHQGGWRIKEKLSVTPPVFDA